MSPITGNPGKIDLAKRVLGFIQRHCLISGQETLVVGVSGGPDSVCLLHLLMKSKDKLGIRFHVAHLNHMVRGTESDADADYVSKLADDLGVAATVERRKVEDYQTEHHLSPEEAAREVRYQFLADVARYLGASRIAVGHTADDQVETILMHLVRGTGAYGLQGMRPLTTLKTPQGAPLAVVRPLLELSRRETEAYCQEHHLAPRRDSSNISSPYLRNRIRHELIPLLRSYNPNIDEVLLRTADTLAGDSSFFKQQLAQIWENIIGEEDGVLVLNTKEIALLHPAIQRYVVREAMRRLLGNLKDIEWRHIENVRSALSLPSGKRLSLPKGLTLHTEYGRCLITTDSAALCPLSILEGEHRLKVPGDTQLPGWQVAATILKTSDAQSVPTSPYTAHLDFETAAGSLTVRGRRGGDMFQPLGMTQPKKLQDFMVDAKIPQAWRDHLPLVCSPEHILWVVGWRIDDRAKVTKNTRQILCLQFLPQSPKSASSS